MFSGMPKLTTLYIDHNQVRTIHPEAFDDLQGEFGNLSCQCHDQQFL
jgi:hypothetical protein